MRSSLKKLRDFALNKHGCKDNLGTNQLKSAAEEPEELKAGMKDIENMREEYDGLLAVAQNTSASAYDFARSIQDMASYMMERFGDIGQGETENVFSLLGKVQYEISKFLDVYATHLSKTITSPTESLLKDLQSVEELKGQYNEKRQLYNQMKIMKPKCKGKREKGDVANDQQLWTLKEELKDCEMALSVCFQSLKCGREHSLLTQVVRHHTAQMQLFHKCFNSVNAVESIIKDPSWDYNIDRTLSDDDVVPMQLDDDIVDEGNNEESVPSSPQSIQAVAPDKCTFSWTSSSSKSMPISPSLYSANKNMPSVQNYFVERPSQMPVTIYALPHPNARGIWTDQANYIEKLHSDEQPTPPGKGISAHASTFVMHDAKQANDTLQANTPYESKHQQEQEHNEIFLRRYQLISRSSNHAVQTDLHDDEIGKPVLSVPRYSYFGPLAVRSNLNLKGTMGHGNRGGGGSGGVSPVVSYPVGPLYKSGPVNRGSSGGASPVMSYPIEQLYKSGPVNRGGCVSPVVSYPVEHLCKSGPVNRSSTWTYVSKVSPAASPPSHLSPPVISELHKLPVPPAKAQGSCTKPVAFGIVDEEMCRVRMLQSRSGVKKSRSVSASVDF